MKRIRATAVVVDNHKLLMIHRFKNGEEYWVLPGGGVEEGETPEEAVLRELKEETSIDARMIKKIFSYMGESEREDQLFLCKYISGELKLAEDSIEALTMNKHNHYEPI